MYKECFLKLGVCFDILKTFGLVMSISCIRSFLLHSCAYGQVAYLLRVISLCMHIFLL